MLRRFGLTFGFETRVDGISEGVVATLAELEENYLFLEKLGLLDQHDQTANLLYHNQIVLYGSVALSTRFSRRPFCRSAVPPTLSRHSRLPTWKWNMPHSCMVPSLSCYKMIFNNLCWRSCRHFLLFRATPLW